MGEKEVSMEVNMEDNPLDITPEGMDEYSEMFDTSDFTDEMKKLMKLGVRDQYVETIITGWKKKSDGKRVFHPNCNEYNNITMGFWNYAMDCLYTVDLLRLKLELLPEKLAEMTLRQLEDRNGSWNGEQLQEVTEFKQLIAELQAEKERMQNKLKKLAEDNQELYITAGSARESEEKMYEDLKQLKLTVQALVQIFVDNNGILDVDLKDYNLTKEMLEEAMGH